MIDKEHIRIFLSSVLSLLFFVLCPLSPVYARSILTVETDGGADYLDGLSQLFTEANRIAPENLTGEGPLLRITPYGAVSIADDFPATAADHALTEAARRMFTLYRAMGGQTGTRSLLLQRTRNGLFSAHEGSAGTVSASLGAAMGGALQALARADAKLPAAAAAWLPQLADAFDNPGVTPPPFPVARFVRGQRTLFTLSGPDIARAGADANLAGPPGSVINILRTQGGQLQASAVFSSAAPEGFAKLYLYRNGDPLTPLANFDVAIGAGRGGKPSAEPDDHGASARTATALLPAGAIRASGKGQISAANDVDMFTLRVTSPGVLTVRSQGSSDVSARLLDRNGNPLASNDDGGAGYNFGMQTPVNPGAYLLSVQHCCGGNGNYQIDTVLSPR